MTSRALPDVPRVRLRLRVVGWLTALLATTTSVVFAQGEGDAASGRAALASRPASRRAPEAPRLAAVLPDRATCAGGESISIFGLNFTESGGTNLLVRIGTALPCAPKLVSAVELVVAAPAGSAGPVDVTVSNSMGSDTLVGGFTYVAADHASRPATRVGREAAAVTSRPAGEGGPARAEVTSLGGGSPGFNATPVNAINDGLPIIGGPVFHNSLAAARPLATAYFVMSTAVPGSPLPGTGGLVFVDIQTAYVFRQVVTSHTGTATMPFQVPDDARLQGLAVNTQWGVLDFVAQGGLALSNALHVRVGY